MSTNPGSSHARWVKSSYSNAGGGNCVEWAPDHGTSGAVPVRDSKAPEGAALTFRPGAWSAFVAALRSG